jgi:diadenylate cyclase
MDALIAFFSTIRWQDVIDITLNSYILFRLYVLFRGTNIFRILVAIAFLSFFQRMAVSFGLVVTSWVVQGITAVAALLIIVIFRHEIRSVLQAKNLKAILWGIPRSTVETPIDILIDAAYELARRRTGALLVLPGKEDLKEFTHSGIPWQGVLSKEMIMSIFWPENPVHDGAAIIQGDMVTEVGAILPLSRRKDLPSYYGTRHRAAAGLAENTDALVIVVSEERSQVAVAKALNIKVIQGKQELAKDLREHLGLSEGPKSRWKKGKLEITLAGLFSILFIFGVWFSFTRGLDTLVTLEVPIEYMNQNSSMVILDAPVNTVRLYLSGAAALVKSMRPDQVQIKLDLGKAIPGTNAYAITQKDISLPPGIELKQVLPSSVQVTLDVLTKKELHVQVDWVGKLAEDLILIEARLTPEKIQVIGGKKLLEKISTIYTEPVRLDPIKKTGTLTINLAMNPPSLRLAPDAKDKVTLDYVVNKRTEKN